MGKGGYVATIDGGGSDDQWAEIGQIGCGDQQGEVANNCGGDGGVALAQDG